MGFGRCLTEEVVSIVQREFFFDNVGDISEEEPFMLLTVSLHSYVLLKPFMGVNRMVYTWNCSSSELYLSERQQPDSLLFPTYFSLWIVVASELCCDVHLVYVLHTWCISFFLIKLVTYIKKKVHLADASYF